MAAQKSAPTAPTNLAKLRDICFLHGIAGAARIVARLWFKRRSCDGRCVALLLFRMRAAIRFASDHLVGEQRCHESDADQTTQKDHVGQLFYPDAYYRPGRIAD